VKHRFSMGASQRSTVGCGRLVATAEPACPWRVPPCHWELCTTMEPWTGLLKVIAGKPLKAQKYVRRRPTTQRDNPVHLEVKGGSTSPENASPGHLLNTNRVCLGARLGLGQEHLPSAKGAVYLQVRHGESVLWRTHLKRAPLAPNTYGSEPETRSPRRPFHLKTGNSQDASRVS
jgi:hypothetical protein